MDVVTSIDPTGRFVRCTVSGDLNQADPKSVLRSFNASAEALKTQRLLLDLLSVTGSLQVA